MDGEWKRMRRIKVISIIFLFMITINAIWLMNYVNGKEQAESVTNWPTSEWNITDPCELDMNGSLMYEMYDYIETNTLNIHSVSVARNGFLIHEEYLFGSQLRPGSNYGPGHPADQVINETLHVQWSVTKTITALNNQFSAD